MHIAVLDDNVVDRNQMERLLTKASDQNKKSGIEGFFIDSYGSTATLVSKAQMYDVLFIDMVESSEDGITIARSLRKSGVVGKIILMISKIDYSEMNNEDEDFIFLNKPIKTAELRALLDECEAERYNKEPMIELRSDTVTMYVHGHEFLYAYSEELEKLTVFLTENRSITFRSTLESFFNGLNRFTNIIPINETAIINVDHIKTIKGFSAVMDDEKVFRLSLRHKGKIKSFISKL